MNYTYDTVGTCSKRIFFEVDENNKVRNYTFLFVF